MGLSAEVLIFAVFVAIFFLVIWVLPRLLTRRDQRRADKRKRSCMERLNSLPNTMITVEAKAKGSGGIVHVVARRKRTDLSDPAWSVTRYESEGEFRYVYACIFEETVDLTGVEDIDLQRIEEATGRAKGAVERFNKIDEVIDRINKKGV